MSEENTYDVFLSHNSGDKPSVEAIGSRLRELGLNPFLDKWHLIPGKPWQADLTVAMDGSECVAIFFGPNGDGPWHNEEMQLALLKAVRTRDDYRLIPVLLPGAEPSQVKGFLELRTWVDFRHGLDDEVAFKRLMAAVKGVAPDSSEGTSELDDDPRPYRGIERFDDEQQQFFFGRDNEIKRLIERLEDDRFVAVVGASGSGKSSLARAGLCTDAAEQSKPGIRSWRRIVLMPKNNPLLQLATSLVAHLPVRERPALVKTFIDTFENSPNGLVTALLTLFPNSQQPVLLLVDQFEELFTQRPSADENQNTWHQCSASFAANLLAAVRHNLEWLHIVVTLRADFVDSFVGGDIPDLRTLLERRQFWLGAIGESDLREVIVRPATQRGAFFEKGLVERILAEMHGEASALPLLEEALGSLWDLRRGPWLTHQDYDDIGGVGGALAEKADRVLNKLNPSDQAIARRVFLGLIQLGEGTRDTRRRIVVASLIAFADAPERVEQVVRCFSAVGVRLITISANSDGEDVAEVTHEALFEHWRQLDEWLDRSRDDLRFQRRLDQAARHWDEQSKAEGVLWRPPDLDLLQQFQDRCGDDMTTLQVEFLHVSHETEMKRIANKQRQQETLQTRLRIAVGSAIAAGVLFAIAFGMGIIANTERTKAITAKNEADTKRVEAESARRSESEAHRQANQDRIHAEASARIANQQRNLAMESISTLVEEVQEQLTDASSHRLKEQLLNTAMQGLERISKNLKTDRHNNADTDLLMAKARIRLGDTYQLLGSGILAREEYHAAKQVIDRLAKDDSPVETHETFIEVLHRLGEVSADQESLSYYKQAMLIADKDQRLSDATRVNCLTKVGKGQLDNGMLEEAVGTTRQAIDLAEHDNSIQSDADRVRNAELYIQLGDALNEVGDWTIALNAFSQARIMLERVSTNGLQRSSIKIALAEVFERGSQSSQLLRDPLKAVEDLLKSLQIYQQLASADPKNATLQADVARVQLAIGNVLLPQNKLGLAATYLQSSLNHFKNLSKADPENLNWIRQQVTVFSGLGDICFLRDGLPGAFRYYKLALDTYDALPKDDQTIGDPFLHAHLLRQLIRIHEKSENASRIEKMQQRLDSIELQPSSEDLNVRRTHFKYYRQFVNHKSQVGDRISAERHYKAIVALTDELHSAKAMSDSQLALEVLYQGGDFNAAGDYELAQRCFERVESLNVNVDVTTWAMAGNALNAQSHGNTIVASRIWDRLVASIVEDDSQMRQMATSMRQRCDKIMHVLANPEDAVSIEELEWESLKTVVVAAAVQENHSLAHRVIKRMTNSTFPDAAVRHYDIAACQSRVAQVIERTANRLPNVDRNEVVEQYRQSTVNSMVLAIQCGFNNWQLLNRDPNLKSLRESEWYSARRQQTAVNSLGMTLVRIPAGSFVQGAKLSPSELSRMFPGESEAMFAQEQPPRTVEISKPFFMECGTGFSSGEGV